jgi:hypothetical protein
MRGRHGGDERGGQDSPCCGRVDELGARRWHDELVSGRRNRPLLEGILGEVIPTAGTTTRERDAGGSWVVG